MEKEKIKDSDVGVDGIKIAQNGEGEILAKQFNENFVIPLSPTLNNIVTNVGKTSNDYIYVDGCCRFLELVGRSKRLISENNFYKFYGQIWKFIVDELLMPEHFQLHVVYFRVLHYLMMMIFEKLPV
jgi:hypothetical protein